MRLRLPPARATVLSPVRPLSRPGVRLFVTSASILVTELFLIRWIPANVVYVGFFSNLLLIGSFLGIGVGILRGRGGQRAPIAAFPLYFFMVITAVSGFRLQLHVASPEEVYHGLTAEASAADVNFLVLPLVVLLTTAVMAVIAMPLGPLMRSMPPLRAYAVDIIGSLAGIAIFTGLSAFETSPAVWVATIACLYAVYVLGVGSSAWVSVAAVALGASVITAAGQGDLWSPYQRITVVRSAEWVVVNVNGIPHQAFPLDPERAPGRFYDQIDRWFPGRRFDGVLVVGAGTGNDVGAAIRRGASRIDAIEIDPVILRVGIQENGRHPYQDPRVSTVVDDGRAFLARSRQRYDLIIYALPDSLTLVTSTASIRLESFLFTSEAFDGVRRHLSPDGVFVMYNFYREPWLLEKIARMLEESFGHPPIVRRLTEFAGTAAILAAGPGIAAVGGLPPGDRVDSVDLRFAPPAATDDWPFLYLREPAIGWHYLAALAMVLVLAVVLVSAATRRSGTQLNRFSPHFFVLGSAFLLLETKSLVTFGLLFGNTWLVNSFVFFAILCSVLAAIAVNHWARVRDPRPFYVGLFAALGLAYLLPPAALLIEPPWLRYLVASVLAFVPVFCANLVFSYSFRDTRTADMAFASNLLGAMVGGMLEYMALITGYQFLLVLVGVLYGLAYLLAARWRFLGDRDLGSGGVVDLAPVESIAESGRF